MNMYSLKNIILFIILAFISGNKIDAQDLSFMTYNIRYSIENNPKDNWDSRKGTMVELFNYYHPDVFGIQEGMIHQLEYIKSNL
jgi:mRNA deadenylase 3'-5' endonuclease subunit Ccr4